MKQKIILILIFLTLNAINVNCQKPDITRSFIVFIDLSVSTKNDRSLYKEYLMSLTDVLEGGDEISVFPITSKTMSDAQPLLDKRYFPKKERFENPFIYNSKKTKFINELKSQITNVCEKIDELPPTPYSDIFSAFAVAADKLPDRKKKYIIILSDMVEDSVIGQRRYNFQRDRVNEDYCVRLIKTLENEKLLPNLSGTTILIYGAKSSDETLSDNQYRSIRKFWELYAKQIGASLKYNISIRDIEDMPRT